MKATLIVIQILISIVSSTGPALGASRSRELRYWLDANCPQVNAQSLPIDRQAKNEHMTVNVTFSLLRFKELSNTEERLSLLGQLGFTWTVNCANLSSCIHRALNQSTSGDKANHIPEVCLFSNVSYLPYKKHEIWHPSVAFINSYDDAFAVEMLGGDVYMRNDSTAYWYALGTFNSICHMSFEKYPMEVQECFLEFESLLPVTLIDYAVISYDIDPANINDFISVSRVFRLVSLSNTSELVQHADGLQYRQLKFYIVLQRKPGYYVPIIIIPMVLFFTALLGTLFMPPDLPDRPTACVTLFLGIAVLISGVFNDIPPTSESILIVYFLMSQLIVAVMVTIYTSLSCSLANQKRFRKMKFRWFPNSANASKNEDFLIVLSAIRLLDVVVFWVSFLTIATICGVLFYRITS